VGNPFLVEVARRDGMIRYAWNSKCRIEQFDLGDKRLEQRLERLRAARPPSERHRTDLLDIDDLRDLGIIEPDAHFILKRIEGIPGDARRDAATVLDVVRRAYIDLQRSDVPLSRSTRDMVAGELESQYLPKREREQRNRRFKRQSRAHEMRRSLDVLLQQLEGVTGKERRDKLYEHAKHWGHKSDYALRKAIQPTRRVR
jgi:hypothetical protein